MRTEQMRVLSAHDPPEPDYEGKRLEVRIGPYMLAFEFTVAQP